MIRVRGPMGTLRALLRPGVFATPPEESVPPVEPGGAPGEPSTPDGEAPNVE